MGLLGHQVNEPWQHPDEPHHCLLCWLQTSDAAAVKDTRIADGDERLEPVGVKACFSKQRQDPVAEPDCDAGCLDHMIEKATKRGEIVFQRGQNYMLAGVAEARSGKSQKLNAGIA